MKATVSQPNIASHIAVTGKRTHIGLTVRVGIKADRNSKAMYIMPCLLEHGLHVTGAKGEYITEAHQFPAIRFQSGSHRRNLQKFSAITDSCPANAGYDNRLSY
jgi:hypothetical protein